MRVGSINNNAGLAAYGTSREESAIRKEILSLRKELQSISDGDDDEDEQEAAIKKREIEQQIAQLEQKLQEVKRQGNQKNSLQSDKNDEEMLKEPGKGDYIDTYV